MIMSLPLTVIHFSGVFSTGAMGALAPAISGQSILSPPISTRNFGTIYYRQHPQSKSPKYAPAFRQKIYFNGIFSIQTVVKVKRSGQIIDVTSLWEMEGGAVSVSSADGSKEKFNFARVDSIKA